MNGLKGKPDPIRFAHLLTDLAKRVEPAELRARLGLTPREFEDKLSLAKFDDGLGKRLKNKQSRTVAPRVLRFTVSKDDFDLIDGVIEALVGDNMDRGEALAYICRDFERNR